MSRLSEVDPEYLYSRVLYLAQDLDAQEEEANRIRQQYVDRTENEYEVRRLWNQFKREHYNAIQQRDKGIQARQQFVCAQMDRSAFQELRERIESKKTRLLAYPPIDTSNKLKLRRH